MNKNWAEGKDSCMIKASEKLRRKLELLDISLGLALKVLLKIINQRFEKKLDVSKSEIEIIERCELALQPYTYSKEELIIKNRYGEPIELWAIPATFLIGQEKKRGISRTPNTDTILVYVSLIGFMEGIVKTVPLDTDVTDSLDQMIEHLIEVIVQFPTFSNKRFEFVFTKPDLLMKILAQGVKYPRKIYNINQPELKLLDSLNNFSQVVNSIIYECEIKFLQLTNKKFNYHIARANDLNEISKVIESATGPHFTQFISPFIRNRLFKSHSITLAYSDITFSFNDIN